jgi:hypothetical protein
MMASLERQADCLTAYVQRLNISNSQLAYLLPYLSDLSDRSGEGFEIGRQEPAGDGACANKTFWFQPGRCQA